MLVQAPDQRAALATGGAYSAPCVSSASAPSSQLNGGFSTSPTTSRATRPHRQPGVYGKHAGNDGQLPQINEKLASSNLVFNYSDTELTEEMIQLLNKGLNFSVLQSKLDITQVLADFKYFERSTIWHEYHHGKETDSEYEAPVFKTKKTSYILVIILY